MIIAVLYWPIPLTQTQGEKNMYFAIDEDQKLIVNEDGDEFTFEQFKTILQNAAEKKTCVDMTLMTQRLISFDFDWVKLNNFYNLDCDNFFNAKF